MEWNQVRSLPNTYKRFGFYEKRFIHKKLFLLRNRKQMLLKMLVDQIVMTYLEKLDSHFLQEAQRTERNLQKITKMK